MVTKENTDQLSFATKLVSASLPHGSEIKTKSGLNS